ALPVELAPEQRLRDLKTGRVRARERLRSTKARITWRGRRGREQAAVPVDLTEGDPDVGEPAEGLQGDGAGVAEQDKPRDPGRHSRELALAELAGEAVADDEAAVSNEDADAVALDDADAAMEGRVAEGGARFGVHGEVSFPCATPPGRSSGRGGLVSVDLLGGASGHRRGYFVGRFDLSSACLCLRGALAVKVDPEQGKEVDASLVHHLREGWR